jgi:hypothetical protein
VDFNAGDMEVIFLADIFLKLSAGGIVELHDLAATNAQQMLVFLTRFHLIVMVFLIEMALIYQFQLFEELQVAIDCRQANPRVLLSGPAIQLVSINMPAAATEQFQ